MKFFTIQ